MIEVIIEARLTLSPQMEQGDSQTGQSSGVPAPEKPEIPSPQLDQSFDIEKSDGSHQDLVLNPSQLADQPADKIDTEVNQKKKKGNGVFGYYVV